MTANPLAGFLGAGAPGGSQVDAILDAMRQHLGMEIAFASRFEGDRRIFTHIRTDIPVPSSPGDSEPLDGTFCHHIMAGRLPELIHNAADYPLAQTLPIARLLPVGAHLTVPLRLRDGSLYGTFCCLSRTADYSLTERDVCTVRAFAELACAQIEFEMDAASHRDMLTRRIEDAISRGQPAIFLQPIHRLDTGRSTGAEALARFTDANERPPNLWFDEAFEVGLGVELELAAIGNALAGAAYIPADHYLSVNLSPETALSDRLGPMLEAAAVPNLVLELTEHSGVKDYAALGNALGELRRHGRIAIDDFGAGYSSLRHIIALEPDILKLDMSLVRGIDRDPARRALAGAMVGFAGRMDASIVAEGVERAEERAVLCDLGVDYGQGYLFSRPMPLVAAQQHMLGGQRSRAHAGPAGTPAPRRRLSPAFIWQPCRAIRLPCP